jgi:hypothetical protein
MICQDLPGIYIYIYIYTNIYTYILGSAVKPKLNSKVCGNETDRLIQKVCIF